MCSGRIRVCTLLTLIQTKLPRVLTSMAWMSNYDMIESDIKGEFGGDRITQEDETLTCLTGLFSTRLLIHFYSINPFLLPVSICHLWKVNVARWSLWLIFTAGNNRLRLAITDSTQANESRWNYVTVYKNMIRPKIQWHIWSSINLN